MHLGLPFISMISCSYKGTLLAFLPIYSVIDFLCYDLSLYVLQDDTFSVVRNIEVIEVNMSGERSQFGHCSTA